MERYIKLEGVILDAAKQKPNLMPMPGASTDHSKRILAALEHGGLALPVARATRRSLDSLTAGLGVALVLLSVMAWIVYEHAKSPPLHLQDTVIGAQAATELNVQPAGAAVLERAAAQPAQPEQPAAIINEPAADRSAAQRHAEHAAPVMASNTAGTATTATSSLAAARSNTPASTITSRRSMPASTPSPAPTAAAISTINTISSAATPVATPAAATPAWIDNRPSSKSSARKAAPAEPMLPAAPADSDVTLLTAMVAHVNAPVVVAPERTRDVVERQDGDRTESLLGRCKLLGPIEGMLCRSRICAGRWDSDAACRVPSH